MAMLAAPAAAAELILYSSPNFEGEALRVTGDVPNLRDVPNACVFQPRCPVAIDVCATTRPPDVMTAAGHCARCHLARGGRR